MLLQQLFFKTLLFQKNNHLTYIRSYVHTFLRTYYVHFKLSLAYWHTVHTIHAVDYAKG